MPLDSNSPLTAYVAVKKDLYEMGKMPPLGHVPKQMYGWAIRKERHGEPDTAMLQEVLEMTTQHLLYLTPRRHLTKSLQNIEITKSNH